MALNAVTGELLQGAKKAEDAAHTLTQMLTHLIEGLDPMHGGLKGAAGSKFAEVKDQIRTDITNINDALREVASGIRSSGQDFDVADNESLDEVNKAAAGADQIFNRLRG